MSSSVANKVTKVVVNEDPAAYEAKHVHEVYDQIASHFSSTRYKVCLAPMLSSDVPLSFQPFRGIVALAYHRSFPFFHSHWMGRS